MGLLQDKIHFQMLHDSLNKSKAGSSVMIQHLLLVKNKVSIELIEI